MKHNFWYLVFHSKRHHRLKKEREAKVATIKIIVDSMIKGIATYGHLYLPALAEILRNMFM